MTLNQLFKKKPPLELVLKILSLLKINSVDDFKVGSFSKNDITSTVLEKMEEMKPLFEEYYIKCKFEIYFTFIDKKKVVTILRQCLKPLEYKLDSRKEYIASKRLIVYSIKSLNKSNDNEKGEVLKTPKSNTIVFD